MSSVKRIRNFHSLGRKIPGKRPHRETFNQGIVRKQAAKRHFNEDFIRKARQFADPTDGYTQEELEELCKLVMKNQPDQEEDLAIFTRTHIFKLLTVKPKRRRAALQRRVIDKGWSTAQLEAELAKRFGQRRHGGRRRQIPANVADFLTQTEGMCERWRRWNDAATRRPDAGEPSALDCLCKELPNLRGPINLASDSVFRLQQAVTDALQKQQPGRAIRLALAKVNGRGTPRSRRKS